MRTARRIVAPIAIVVAALFSGCRTAPKLPPIDLAEPGWTTRQGQAVWRAKRGATDIAGDLVVASRPDGCVIAEFIKTPFPIVIARLTATNWQIEFGNRSFTGSGPAPRRIGWLQLARGLAGQTPLSPWKFSRSDGAEWRLDNGTTGEAISGYFAP